MISSAAHAECVRLLELLTNPRVQESWSWVFMKPVAIPGYDKVIKKPMDLGTVKKNLGVKPSRCRFKSHEKFARDVRLVFHNALLYNKADQDVKGSVYAAAQHLLRVFETAYAKSIESVFKTDDAAIKAHKEEKRRAEGSSQSAGTAVEGDGDGGTAPASSSSSHRHHHSHHHSSSSSSRRHHADGEEGSKHKRHSKKEKKSKKSKKKSKDKDKERKHSSSSSGDSKKKSHRSSSSHTSGADPFASSAAVEHAPVVSSSKDSLGASSSAHGNSHAVKKSEDSAARHSSSGKMTDEVMSACLALLMRLIKYKEGSISPAAPFLQPVDLTHFPDYRVKVPHRMHLYGVQKKLRSGSYATMDAFAHDVRLIFSNCLVYNSDVILSKVMRSHAVTLMKLFENQFAKIGGKWPGIPERWKCHQILHEILAHRTDDQETVQWFKYPIESYYDSPDQIPYGYYKKVKTPMDIGTVSSRLHLGEYKHASEFQADMKLVFDNCIRYWKTDPQGQAYCDSADTLQRVLQTQSAKVLGSSGGSDKSSSKEKHRSSSKSTSSKPSSSSAPPTSSSSGYGSSSIIPGPVSGEREKNKKRSSKPSSRDLSLSGSGLGKQKEICVGILKQLRTHKMKGFRGIEIKTAGPFLTAVDTTKYPDYLKIVSEPMDFATIERKLKGDRYGSVNEFSADVHLIFSNCHKYNSDPVEGADIRAMATNLRNYFVELCNEKLGGLDGSKSVPLKELASSAAGSSKSLLVSTSKPPAVPLLAVESKPPRAVHSATSSSPHKKPKKLFAEVSTKQLPTEAASAPSPAPPASAAVREGRKEVKPTVSEKPAKAGVDVKANAPPAALPIRPSSSVASGDAVSSVVSSQAVSDPEELKKLRKEKKEKREKKKDKKKDKKKKKEKKRDKKDKKERVKLPSSSTQGVALADAVSSSSGASEAKLVPSVPAPSAPLPLATASALASGSTPTSSVAAPISSHPSSIAVAAPARSIVGSKHGLVEPQLSGGASSNKKSKKHKKSDLSSWEAACERVLNRLGKIEQVAKLHFDHPLTEVFPQLTAEYLRLISEPMDLRTLREQLHAHKLTQSEFLRKGRLIFQNAVTFNCADDPASAQVRDMSTHLMWYFDSLCAELQLFSASEGGAEGWRAKRDQLRRERAEFVNNVPVELKARECHKLLRVLNSQKYDKNCWPFRKPVRVLFPTLSAEYFEIIKTPMDLSTISEKLNAFEYKVHGEFIRDVRLTLENAMVYNRSDKEREGWNVYAAAVHILTVVDELWSDVTLEVTEKVRRRELLRKERLSDSKRKKSEKQSVSGEKVHKHRHHKTAEEGAGHHHHHHHKSGKHRSSASTASSVSGVVITQAPATATVKPAATPASAAKTTAIPAAAAPAKTTPATPSAAATAGTSAVGAIATNSGATRDGVSALDPSATRVKLQLLPNRPNMERMNKSERKAEEKRRKRARREEEIARSEKRRRTAVAATDDALREAELRSRRKLQKQEMAEAVRLREEREKRTAEEETERARRAQMKLNTAAWTGVLMPVGAAATKASTSFWSKKRVKLQVPSLFQPAINAS